MYIRRMAVFVAFLRAVNVGGTGKLAMSDLRALCEDAGFSHVRTYIQSGNVAFATPLAAAPARQKLEAALERRMGKPVDLHLRTPSQLEAIVKRNPFKTVPPNRLLVLFLDRVAPKQAVANLEIPGREEVVASGRELFIHYPDGMGRSKLKIPFASGATGRNLNTVRKMIEIGRATPTNQ